MTQDPLVALLRERISQVRDGFQATNRERMELYLFLKCTPAYRAPSMAVKLGAKQQKWLLDLEAYGDEHGWYARGLAAREKRRAWGAQRREKERNG